MRLYSFSRFHSQQHFLLFFPPLLFSTQTKRSHTHKPIKNETNPLQNYTSHPNNSDPLHYLQYFCTLTKTLSKNPRNYTALTTLDSLLTQTHSLDSASSLIVIDCLSQIKKLGRAKTLLSNLKTKGKLSDYFLYSLVFDCLVKDGKIKDVETVWDEICSGFLPIQRIDISDYVIYLSKFGGFDEISGICERILVGCWVLRRQSYVALVGALCRVNQGLLAKEVLKEMHDKEVEVDDFTYFVMFQCLCRNGDLDGADFMLRKLVERKFHIDICIYGSFINALCVLGKFREANKLFRRLVQRDGVGRFKKVEFLKEGRRAIFQLNSEGAVPKIMAYGTYFRSLCNVGRLDEGEVLLKKMMKSRVVPQICVYGSFIKALFRAGRGEDAMKFFGVEMKKGFVGADEIARYVIMGLCETSRVDDALRIFDEIVSIGGFVNYSSACHCILSSYWRIGRVAEAECFFERLRDINFGPFDVLTYTTMIDGYCNQGDVSKALGIFEEILRSNMMVNGTLYEIIIRGLCASGRLKEALKYFNDMIENGHLISCKRWKILFDSTFIADEH